jgi:hypothetical protein
MEFRLLAEAQRYSHPASPFCSRRGTPRSSFHIRALHGKQNRRKHAEAGARQPRSRTTASDAKQACDSRGGRNADPIVLCGICPHIGGKTRKEKAQAAHAAARTPSMETRRGVTTPRIIASAWMRRFSFLREAQRLKPLRAEAKAGRASSSSVVFEAVVRVARPLRSRPAGSRRSRH